MNIIAYQPDNQSEKYFIHLGMKIPIGKVVKEILDENPQFTRRGLAKAIGVKERTISNLYLKNSWDSAYIEAASEYLNRNLFQYYQNVYAGNEVNEEQEAYKRNQANHHLTIQLGYNKNQFEILPEFLKKIHELAEEYNLKIE